jgi:hypothetical protein
MALELGTDSQPYCFQAISITPSNFGLCVIGSITRRWYIAIHSGLLHKYQDDQLSDIPVRKQHDVRLNWAVYSMPFRTRRSRATD